MKKLYEKNELTFALVWIAIYVVGTSLAEALSESISVYKLVSAVFHIALTAALFLWVRRNGLMEKYGLFLPRYRLLQAWFFIPLALVCLYKLVFSPALRFSATESRRARSSIATISSRRFAAIWSFRQRRSRRSSAARR